ncbi:peptidylprolyl isomerase [Novosphingobium sp.]|uniref:peptidylprolyl isomerase n=1 Tax=Novosphingobium sp. TaxID=1874826 RepID=UPI0027330B4E|nr:peptidylprolyl isomerase [Novosphingobium sp.]MDP3907083.1 peptidylprolyl isomerase [Novosphingobium sp.]
MTWRSRAAGLLREPLVHFMIAGALVFAVLSGRPPDTGERRIVVSEAVANRLVERWMQSFRRAPTADEVDGLIRDYVMDQVYYREALRLGLDQDDEVVIRRLRNKMVGLAASDAEAKTPTDAQLQALIDADPARYAAEPLLDFKQVYLGGDTPAARAAAAQALAALQRGEAADALRQPAPIPASFSRAPASEVAAVLGQDFVAGLAKLPVGQWSGPVPSGAGLHLVRIERRDPPPTPRLADVRKRVENDWRSAATQTAVNAAYAKLLDGYDVVIERP